MTAEVRVSRCFRPAKGSCRCFCTWIAVHLFLIHSYMLKASVRGVSVPQLNTLVEA